MKTRKKIVPLMALSAAAVLFTTGLLFPYGNVNAENNSLRGDVNGDGRVNILDLIELKNILLGFDVQTEETTAVTEETINVEETNYEAAVTETPVTYSYDETSFTESDFSLSADVESIQITENQYPDYAKIANRSQIITNKQDYAVYLDELNIPENISEKILSKNKDFDKYVFCILTITAEDFSIIAPAADISRTNIDFSYTREENLKRDYSNNVDIHLDVPSTYIFEIRIPKNNYFDQNVSVKEEEESEISYLFEKSVDFAYKPVIYLYPEKTTDINVKLSVDGDLKYTYPQYSKGGWNVTAEPDSVLHDASGREYSYLFWEGTADCKWDMSEGFVVKGSDTVSFLQDKLSYLGLTPKEYNDFIVFWLPKMQDNKYNLISFQTDVYEDYAKLEVTPKPDSMQRVFMAFKPLDKYENVPEQKLEPFTRHGYSVIEWGGTQIG